MAVRGRHTPQEFLRAVQYGQKHRHAALSSMKWMKTFTSGNSATVYGVELDGKSVILKITQHRRSAASHDEEDPQCVGEDDIHSLRQAAQPCFHRPKRGLIIRPGCSADPHLGNMNEREIRPLGTFVFHFSTLRVLCRGESHSYEWSGKSGQSTVTEADIMLFTQLPAAASVPNSFAKDTDVWYLMFEELPGISPLKYGENILQRLAKPLSE
jgi:hypothetical protein